jgi:hypothetical protein
MAVFDPPMKKSVRGDGAHNPMFLFFHISKGSQKVSLVGQKMYAQNICDAIILPGSGEFTAQESITHRSVLLM